jgi:hypothetical protein
MEAFIIAYVATGFLALLITLVGLLWACVPVHGFKATITNPLVIVSLICNFVLWPYWLYTMMRLAFDLNFRKEYYKLLHMEDQA